MFPILLAKRSVVLRSPIFLQLFRPPLVFRSLSTGFDVSDGIIVAGVQQDNPSEKQIAFANRLADEQGVRVPSEAMKGGQEMSQFIEEMLEKQQGAGTGYTNDPSEKQIEFANRLADEQGVRVPPKAMGDRQEISRFIEEMLEKQRGAGTGYTNVPSEKQIVFANRLADEQGVRVPSEAMKGRQEMSQFIGAMLEKQRGAGTGYTTPLENKDYPSATQLNALVALCRQAGEGISFGALTNHKAAAEAIGRLYSALPASGTASPAPSSSSSSPAVDPALPNQVPRGGEQGGGYGGIAQGLLLTEHSGGAGVAMDDGDDDDDGDNDDGDDDDDNADDSDDDDAEDLDNKAPDKTDQGEVPF